MASAKFIPDKLTITIYSESGSEIYEIDLENCINSAEVLDYILQLTRKQWCTPQLLFEFIEELDNACEQVFDKDAQGIFCPMGQNHRVDWSKKTSERIIPSES